MRHALAPNPSFLFNQIQFGRSWRPIVVITRVLLVVSPLFYSRKVSHCAGLDNRNNWLGAGGVTTQILGVGCGLKFGEGSGEDPKKIRRRTREESEKFTLTDRILKSKGTRNEKQELISFGRNSTQ